MNSNRERNVSCALYSSFSPSQPPCGLPASLPRNGAWYPDTSCPPEENFPVPNVSILVSDTEFGTASKEDGTYTLRLPPGEHALRFSAVGFETTQHLVAVRPGETTVLDVRLDVSVVQMQDVVVEEELFFPEPGVYALEPEVARNLPSPFKGFQALSVLPGVAANNELSNQYSVHGGGFHENLIFVNGFEVYHAVAPEAGGAGGARPA